MGLWKQVVFDGFKKNLMKKYSCTRDFNLTEISNFILIEKPIERYRLIDLIGNE